MAGYGDDNLNVPPPREGDPTIPKVPFDYLAMDGSGRELRGSVVAADDIEAVAKLKKQGLFPIEVWRKRPEKPRLRERAARPPKPPAKARTAQGAVTRRSRGSAFLEKIGMVPVIRTKILCAFTRQLSTMLDAGLPLLLSLRTLQEQCGRGLRYRSLKAVLQDVLECVENGMPFSEALQQHPRSFNRLYIGLVRAGEASGSMEDVLRKLAEYIEKMERMKKKVIAGMTYPVVVLVIALAITLGLMMGVVPKFAEMFDEILEGIPLPVLTSWVIAVSDFLMHRWWALGIILFGAVVVLKILRKTTGGRYLIDWGLVTVPPLNGLLVKVSVGRFCSTLGSLLDSGVPILDALQIARETATNTLMQRTVQKVREVVTEGEKVATPLEDARLFPGMVVRMIDIGEQTGALPDMLKRIARTYEEEVEATLESLISLIEPIMIVLLAIIIGGIVIALFLPLIKIIESLGV